MKYASCGNLLSGAKKSERERVLAPKLSLDSFLVEKDDVPEVDVHGGFFGGTHVSISRAGPALPM